VKNSATSNVTEAAAIFSALVRGELTIEQLIEEAALAVASLDLRAGLEDEIDLEFGELVAGLNGIDD